MFQINEDLSIYATRGDIVFFSVTAEDEGKNYKFQPGDVVRIKVYGKKDAESVVLQKDFPVLTATEAVEIFLSKEDMKIGDVISKHKDYWYEIVLNDDTNPQTIIGYDEDGAKVFRLFPEGDDIPPYEPEPEVVKVMDDELDLTSQRPVQNQAIARAITRLEAAAKDNAEGIAEYKGRFDNLVKMEDKTVSQTLAYLDFITENTKAKIDGRIESDGVFANITVNLREANLIYGGTEMEVFVVPDVCRPMEAGVIHTEDGLEYRIKHDGSRYVLSLKAQDDVTVAPSGAGTVRMSYALDDYELKDLRLGANGVVYPTAGEAVRAQIGKLNKALLTRVTPEMFGAVGDGETDDSAAIQKAVDTGEIVELGAKTYALHETINLPVGVKVTGSKNSVIYAYAPTVFHLTEKNTISGFTIRVMSADVLSVFEADDNSGGANVAGDGALIFTTIENMTVYRDVTDAVPLYTVFHFHVSENSFYGIKVHSCTCVCNGTNGYAARVYSNGSGWLSTCSFIDCNTSGFNWHYFFAENDKSIASNSGGRHALTNCVGQCTPQTHGFAFLPNIYSASITNCTTWDWGSAEAGSLTCHGRPYVIGPNQESVQMDSICNDIGLEGIATYDGTTFGTIGYDATKAMKAGARYSTYLIPKYTGIPMVPCVKLLTANSDTGKRVRFYVCDHRGITYVSVYPYEKKAVLSRPLLDIRFALSADGKTIFMYKVDGGNLPANMGILTLPVSNLMIRFGSGNTNNTELTPDVWREPDKRWMDALPSDAVTIPNRVEPNAYVSDEDGNYYKISIVTAPDGTKSIGFSRAYDSTRETDY